MALEVFEKLILADPNYKRSAGRRRVLLADAPAPPRVIDRETVCEKDYDVVTTGEPTEHVLQSLEGARLFIDVEWVRKDVDKLRAAVEGHAWPKMWTEWKRKNALPKDPHAEAAMLERWMSEHPALLRKAETGREAHQLIQKLFVSTHRTLKQEYGSLLGRLRQAESVLRQVDGASALVEVKTGYEKVRNRRFQARHFWPTEASVKKGLEQVVLPLEATRGWTDYEIEEPFKATTSPRGRWFSARAWEPDNHRIWNDDTGGTWEDDFAGPIRPLVGVDMSASMYQIAAVVTGDSAAEQYLRNTDLKPALFAGLREADHHRLGCPVTLISISRPLPLPPQDVGRLSAGYQVVSRARTMLRGEMPRRTGSNGAHESLGAGEMHHREQSADSFRPGPWISGPTKVVMAVDRVPSSCAPDGASDARCRQVAGLRDAAGDMCCVCAETRRSRFNLTLAVITRDASTRARGVLHCTIRPARVTST
jgi:hypothetical protein